MSRTHTRRSARRRLTGVDAARGLALLGMFTVHVLPTTDELTGEATWAGTLFAGRSAALFAVLAGVGIALLTGGTKPERPSTEVNRDRVSLAVRAGVIVLIGLLVSLLPAGVAIILVHYGVMFILALPFLRLRAPGLFLLAGVWAVAGPAFYWVWQNALREGIEPWESPERLWRSPILVDVFQPLQLLQDLVVTGYYPLLVWPAYVFFGMALGRLDLRRISTALMLVVGGAFVAAVTAVIGWWVREHSTMVEVMLQIYGGTPEQIRGAMVAGDHQVPLILDERWFLLDAAHQNTPVEVIQAMGCAAGVVGVCLLIAKPLPWLLAPLSGAGSMPLTLYVGHLVMLSLWRDEEAPLHALSDAVMLTVLIGGALGMGLLKALLGRRGPLEAMTHAASAAATGRRR
ncbi:heparan-alpha-glucosaminide N-acetyltransferase domain-containing protein [Nesterenkonia alba]|uniref:heparan-alpha-glucosaminide N-acetyltransferase domain-containing protein n=1 Tax=Nesterenkonia alba TaxID=515814 RepID=UPI0003B43E00|nr:heparan-alpha-glucosaminide N-acetyltransferase domain-containing protein [Nesterenkonia alba]